jgi:hypothetical protein
VNDEVTPDRPVTIDQLIRELLAELAVSRVTVRLEGAGGRLPVTHEALARGANSIKDEEITPDMRQHPIVHEVLLGRQVVHNDCVCISREPGFLRLLEKYGGLRAQILTPVTHHSDVIGIVSVHQLNEPRFWSELETTVCLNYAHEISRRLNTTST